MRFTEREVSVISRFDKYEPFGGGFRAPLDANWNPANFNKALGAGLNAAGRVVIGAGQTGILGVIVLQSRKNAGDPVDTMTDGEIVEFPGVPGTKYYAAPDGTISTTDTGVYVGHTVEGTRLVVRARPAGGAA